MLSHSDLFPRSVVFFAPFLAATVARADILQPTTIPLAGEPTGVVAVDLDGDGDRDVVVAQSALDRVAVYLTSPDGTIAAAGFQATGRVPVSIAAGDVDEDGNADLVVANQNADELSVLLGDGSGGFAPGTPVAIGHTFEVELADMDADGHLDLVAAAAPDLIYVHEGAGDGTFTPRTQIAAGGAIGNFALAPIDGDAWLDLLVGASFEGPQLYLQEAPFEFADDLTVGFSFGPLANWIAAADMDQDGNMDVAWTESDGWDYDPILRLGNGDGTFGQYGTIDSDFDSFDRVEFGRLNGDTDMDSISIAGLHIRVRLGVPTSGGFDFSGHEDYIISSTVSGLVAADLDGDGLDEVVATSALAGELVVFSNTFCASTPVVDTVTPTQVPALADPPVQLDLFGCGLHTVESIAVAGQPLSTGEFSVVDTTSVSVVMPPAPQLGTASVLLESPEGNVESAVEYVAPDPLLVLGNGGDLVDGQPTSLRIGSAPNDFVLLFASPHLVPSDAPGLVTLDIGNGFSTLFFFGTLTVPAPAWTELSLTFQGLPAGIQAHFQGAVLPAANPVAPLLTTNAVTGTIVP